MKKTLLCIALVLFPFFVQAQFLDAIKALGNFFTGAANALETTNACLEAADKVFEIKETIDGFTSSVNLLTQEVNDLKNATDKSNLPEKTKLQVARAMNKQLLILTQTLMRFSKTLAGYSLEFASAGGNSAVKTAGKVVSGGGGIKSEAEEIRDKITKVDDFVKKQTQAINELRMMNASIERMVYTSTAIGNLTNQFK